MGVLFRPNGFIRPEDISLPRHVQRICVRNTVHSVLSVVSVGL